MTASKTIIITSVPKCVGSDGTLGSEVGIKLKSVNSVLRCNNNAPAANKMVIPKSNSVNSTGCEDSQVCIPNRKRRLDHLTFEQKLQRKKLKNRVAAQSSRDRKKARLDDLEAQVKALREKNEALTQQCHNLHLEKLRLATENQQLRQKMSSLEHNHQTHDVGCSTRVEPAAGTGTAAGSGPGASGFDYVDDPEVLPSLPDLLDSLDGDVCLSHLDELAQSLLREAAEEMDTEHRQARAEVGTYRFQGKSNSCKVVGSSPEDVETNRELITSAAPLEFTSQDNASSPSIPDIQDSSQYLVPNQNDTCDTSAKSVFGTYDELTHTITIVVPQDDVCVEDAVQEVVTSDVLSLVPTSVRCTVPCKNEPIENPVSPCSIRTLDSLSPAPCSPHLYDTVESVKLEPPLSDCGYESLDSPQSEISGNELVDVWSESFSHLFPALM